MKLGYWVVTYRSISDELAVKAYGALAVPAIESCGGRFLTTRSTGRIEAHEAGSQQRTILVEFDSYDIAVTAYKNAYQAALRALDSGAERDFASSKARDAPHHSKQAGAT